MDFFTPVVAPDRYHPNFDRIKTINNPYDQALFSHWATGFIDRDGKLVKEFQTTFNSTFWEIYLHAVLKHQGCTLDFSNYAPDFVVTGPIPFTMEATIASNAQGTLPEHTLMGDSKVPLNLNEFNRLAVLRLVNSITEKSKKYINSYQHLPHVKDKPFVIGVAPFDQPYAYLQVHRAIDAALYGYYVDEQEYRDDPAIIKQMPTYSVGTVYKNPETQIPLGLFNNCDYSHVSAIVFSSCASWGKVRMLSTDPNPLVQVQAVRSDPRNGSIATYTRLKKSKFAFRETLLDGLRVYHNPHALLPLDHHVFRSREVFQGMMIDADTGQWVFEIERAPLIFRVVQTVRSGPSKRVIDTIKKSKAARQDKKADRMRKKKDRKRNR